MNTYCINITRQAVLALCPDVSPYTLITHALVWYTVIPSTWWTYSLMHWLQQNCPMHFTLNPVGFGAHAISSLSHTLLKFYAKIENFVLSIIIPTSTSICSVMCRPSSSISLLVTIFLPALAFSFW